MNDDMHDMIDKASKAPTDRRRFLKGAAAAGVGVALAPYLGKVGFASASTAPSVPGTAAAGSAAVGSAVGDAVNPFGMADSSTVDAVIFNGGYGIDYVQYAADIFGQVHDGSEAKITPSTQIGPELQPRFVGGNPPDLIDNSGAQSIGFNTILDQLEDLSDVFDAPNLEGTTIRDTLFGGVTAPGTFGDKFAAINYALTVYALWYSSSLFEENGWTPPTTWAEAKDLGAKAKEAGKYLFVWGMEAATYYQTLAIESAIKEGGDEVRLALENLDGGLLVASRTAGGLHRDEGDHRPRVLRSRRRRHAVHGGPGAVDPRPVRSAVPVGLVDRERDEGADGGRLRDEGRPGSHRDCRRRDARRPRCTPPPASRTSCRPTVPTWRAARNCCASCCRRTRRRTSARRSSPRRSSRASSPRTASAPRRSCRRPTCSPPPAMTSSPGTSSTTTA